MTDLLTLSPDALFDNFDLYNPKIEVGVRCREEERPSACVIRDLRPLFDLHYEAMMSDRLEDKLKAQSIKKVSEGN